MRVILICLLLTCTSCMTDEEWQAREVRKQEREKKKQAFMERCNKDSERFECKVYLADRCNQAVSRRAKKETRKTDKGSTIGLTSDGKAIFLF